MSGKFKSYVGCKMVFAYPMTLGEYNEYRGWVIPENEDPKREGYLVEYADGYKSWSPKEVFEKSYLEVSYTDKITPEVVKSFIKSYEVMKMGDKTLIVQATLVNGFVITEAASCVDPANFDAVIGTKIALEKIENKIWELLGFLLQTSINGIKQ